MDGKPLLEIYENPKEIKYIDSWENNTNFGGELVVKSKGDKSTNEAAMQQLIDLGYIDDLNLDTESEDPTESLNLILKIHQYCTRALSLEIMLIKEYLEEVNLYQ
jgi:hypothetical protein